MRMRTSSSRNNTTGGCGMLVRNGSVVRALEAVDVPETAFEDCADEASEAKSKTY
jgi:hypothetical protein